MMFLRSSHMFIVGSLRPDDGPTTFGEQPSLESLFGYLMKVGVNTTIEGERRSSSALPTTDVNTLSSEKPRVNGPGAGSEHCQGCTYDR
jgi:hypothetical protein